MKIQLHLILLISILFSINHSAFSSCGIPSPLNSNVTLTTCSEGDGSTNLTIDGDFSADTVFITGSVDWDYDTLFILNNAVVVISATGDLNLTAAHFQVGANSSFIIEGGITQNQSIKNEGVLVLHNEHTFSNITNSHRLLAKKDLNTLGSISNTDSIKVGGDINIAGSLLNYSSYVYSMNSINIVGATVSGFEIENHTFPPDDQFWDYFNPLDLPVELIFFSIFLSNDQLKVQWATASEENASHFILERSFDEINWESIQRVEAQGNSQVRVDYHANFPVSEKTVHIRLKQIDFDGQTTYYLPQRVAGLNTKSDLSIYPNYIVSGSNVNIHCTNENPISIEIYDIHGIKITSLKDEKNTTINTNGWASGYYILKALIGTDYVTKRFYIQ
ncbi:T9SS type A sorting domain-containing protein [Flammeovirga pacifica]|uniref:Secretion system C-terminal sorting domain-containing protein n=1 Tax=Flammeovirga pacifica TaxID=915059 RepID=A0A1S1Z4V1_FLAPC|nr:T9SS type A sorting domain-containing protein [Flammeovirga pacifica]OHX68318.1 hypothetical protein NH26_19180 [Flammeovirga pacifica]